MTTPKTDAAAFYAEYQGALILCVTAKFARELEEQVQSLSDALDKAEEENSP